MSRCLWYLLVAACLYACAAPTQEGGAQDAAPSGADVEDVASEETWTSLDGKASGGLDAGLKDTSSSPLPDVVPQPDAAEADLDGAEDASDASAPAAPTCGEVTWSFKPEGSPSQVLLSGPFNGWASTADKAAVLSDPDGDGTWEVTLKLTPGKWQYKFIVDGVWQTDPNNPETVDDGFGGKNSVLSVEPCVRALELDSYTIQGGALEATWSTVAGAVSSKDLSLTVDQAAQSGGLTWEGGKLKLNVSGLAQGIHDVRLLYDGPLGADSWLLKVYVGVSSDWRDATIYFVMTDRFVNGDTSNDNPVAGVDPRTNFSGGDFVGVTEKIKSGYFTKLGVGALWLSWPLMQPVGAEEGLFPDGSGCGLGPSTVKYSPMKYTGYHGYWPVDTGKLEPRYGTLKELKELVVEAHKQGIRVLLDYTANHVHSASPWFAAYQDLGWFHTPAEVCQDVGWENKPVTCWFTSYLADLNYDHPGALEASLDSAIEWAKLVGADGFRLDAVKHMEMGFMTALRQRAKQEMELTGVDFYIVGETFTGDAQAIQSFIGADKIHGQFDFPTNMQLLKALAKQEMGLGVMDDIIRGIRGVYDNQGEMMSTFIGNHDMARFISHASGALPCGVWDIISNQAAGWKQPPTAPQGIEPYERLRLAFAYIYTTPGIPLIYYGDEFGMPGAGDPDNRRMMRFDKDLAAHESATLEWMQKLGALRATHSSLRVGQWSQPLWKDSDLIAYMRSTATEMVVVLLHRGGAEKKGELTLQGVAEGSKFKEWFSGAEVTVKGGKLAFSAPARSAQAWVLQP